MNSEQSFEHFEQFEDPIDAYMQRGHMANEAVKSEQSKTNETLGALLKKAKQLAVTAALALSITAALSACGGNNSGNQAASDTSAAAPTETAIPELKVPTADGIHFNSRGTITEEDTTSLEGIAAQKAGELPNGVHYDYSHYADVKNKVGNNPYSYDYDLSECYGDEEKTAEELLKVAARTPEVLASYAHQILFDSEKEELGIKGMTMTELDDYLSNSANADGGELQKALLDKLDTIFHDEENTAFTFYREYGPENSNYIYFYDANGDGIMAPEEMHLAQSPRQRKGERQVDILRNNGQDFVKVGDFNLPCGGQLNFTDKEVPAGVPVLNVEMPDEAPAEVPDEKPDEPKDNETPAGEGSSGGNNPPKDSPKDDEIIITHNNGGGSSTDTSLNKKNEAAERQNAGVGQVPITQAPLNESVTPQTTQAQDEANFAAMREREEAKQREAAEAAARQAAQAEAEQKAAAEAAARREAERQQAEKEAAERAEAERQAAEAARAAEAERIAAEDAARRAAEAAEREAAAKRQADEAAAKAAAEAARRAAEAAEEESSAAEEAEAREEAQEEANEAAEAMESQAEEMSTNDEERDAADWESGAFDLG